MPDSAQWREFTDDEVRLLFIVPPPDTDYQFYLFERKPKTGSDAFQVVGVWEERHEPLLLHLRPMCIKRNSVAFWASVDQDERRRHKPDWVMPFNLFAGEGPGVFSGTNSELAHFVTFLEHWAGDPSVMASETVEHFMRVPPWYPNDLEKDMISSWDEAPEPTEDMPFEPEDLPTERDSAPIHEEVPEILSVQLNADDNDYGRDMNGQSEWPEGFPEVPNDRESDAAYDRDPEQLYFSELQYRYLPDPEIPTESELLTLVTMPALEMRETEESVSASQDESLSRDRYVGATTIYTFRRSDLHSPDFDPYIDHGLGSIDLNRAALRDYIALLKYHIEQRQRKET